MKNKILIILSIAMFLVCTLTVTSFATITSANASLKADKTSYVLNSNEKITVTLKLDNLKSNNGIIAYSAKLEYDKNKLEYVECSGAGKWLPSYSDENGLLIADRVDNNFPAEGENICVITFKPKAVGENIVIKITNIELSSGEIGGKGIKKIDDVQVPVTIKADEQQPSTPGGGSGSQGGGSTTPGGTGEGSGNQGGNTEAPGGSSGNQGGNTDVPGGSSGNQGGNTSSGGTSNQGGNNQGGNSSQGGNSGNSGTQSGGSGNQSGSNNSNGNTQNGENSQGSGSLNGNSNSSTSGTTNNFGNGTNTDTGEATTRLPQTGYNSYLPTLIIATIGIAGVLFVRMKLLGAKIKKNSIEIPMEEFKEEIKKESK